VDGGQMNIHGAFLHVLNDAIGSVIAVQMLWPTVDVRQMHSFADSSSLNLSDELFFLNKIIES
jgi:hypothetical protein